MSAMQRSREPTIWQFDGFLDSAACRALSALARLPRWAEEKPDGPINHTGYCVEVAVEDQRLLDLRARLESLVGMESDIADTFRYRWYRPGEGHRPHLDCYTVEDRDLLATAMISLQTTQEGGETRFPLAGLDFPPVEGRLLVWYNHLPDGESDPLSRHEGRPVIAGEKEVLLYFFYKQREFAWIRPQGE